MAAETDGWEPESVCACVLFFIILVKPPFSSLQNGQAVIFGFHFTTVPSARVTLF